MSISEDVADRADDDFCYLTTTGRRTGRAHTIEIWFGLDGDRVYMLAGGGDRSDWMRNLRADPQVSVRLGETSFTGAARIVDDRDEDGLARRLLTSKYQDWKEGRPMSEWGRTAVAIAVDLHATEG